MFKSNKGFTLVELIVVIAILAILAGIAIPAYTGYIQKAKDAAALSEFAAIKTAAQAANATSEEVEKIEVDANGNVTVTPAGEDFAIFYQTSATELKALMEGTSYEEGAVWENGEWSVAE